MSAERQRGYGVGVDAEAWRIIYTRLAAGAG